MSATAWPSDASLHRRNISRPGEPSGSRYRRRSSIDDRPTHRAGQTTTGASRRAGSPRRDIAAENEAKAQRRLAQAYRDNRAVLQYELALRRLEVGAALAGKAPQPVVVRTDGTGGGDVSALSTLLTAQLLPRTVALPARGAAASADDAD
ncbi:hypothetical protein [Solwaraspora sp. WMMA2065]|uniref:hypothetical protein n=1 Tax=Solwaraspora sp. WMMA2065 TaxID=3015166 RepID=UPI00259B09D5|nr:hypothetical protein [Solwaraspora sp. WMMA2065]WJK35409.1 hypothetical protein O7610_03245 [Solwaraspora sp. WMMA2065]